VKGRCKISLEILRAIDSVFAGGATLLRKRIVVWLARRLQIV